MVSSSNCHQLVLFDCNDNRLSLFKDHETYLSRIPSNCECYIFWNDLKLPVYRRLKWILEKYSHIHLCPSYNEHLNSSYSSDLLFYLDRLIYKFSSVLLVHGHDQWYNNIFKYAPELDGIEKLEFKVIDEPFNQHLSHIVKYLRRKKRKNRDPKDLLKPKRKSFSPTIAEYYNNYPISYDLEETISFKRIIKRKKKNLELYYHNIRCCETTELSVWSDVHDQDEQDYDYVLSIMYEETQSSVCEADLQFPPNIDESSNRALIQEEDTRRMKSPVDCKKQTKVTSTNAGDSSLYNRPKTEKQEHSPKLQMEDHSKKTIVQEHRKSKKRDIRSTKPVSSALLSEIHNRRESDKKLTFRRDDIFHYTEKHPSAHVFSSIDPPDIRKTSTTMMQEETKTIEDINITKTPSFKCFQCSKTFRRAADRVTHSIAKHTQPTVATTTKAASVPHNQTEVKQTQIKGAFSPTNVINKPISCSQCTKKFKNTTDFRQHFDIIHAQSSPIIITTNQASSSIAQAALKQKKTNENAMNLAYNSTSCWKYSEELEPSINHGSHSNMKHAESSSPATTILPSPLAGKTTQLSNQKKSAENKTNAVRVSCQLSMCPMAFTAFTARDMHSNAKHREPNSTNNTKPSNDRNNPTTMPKAQVKITPDIENSAQRYPCWKCADKFKTTGARFNHFIATHTAPCEFTTTMSSYHPDPHTTSTQEEVNSVQVMKIPIKNKWNCWQCAKKFKFYESLISHFIDKHASFIRNIKTDPSNVLQNQIAISQERLTTEQKMASYNCSQCSQKFESADARSDHCNVEHAASSVPTITLPLNHSNNQTIAIKNQSKVTERTTSSIISSHHTQLSDLLAMVDNDDVHLNAKQTESNPFKNTGLSSVINNQSTMMNNQGEIAKDKHDFVKKFICWKCSKKFKSAHVRSDHFLKNHSESFLPIINVPSIHAGDQTTMEERQTNSFNVSINPLNRSCNCWNCGEEFKSHRAQISHFVEKHAKALLCTDTDPSNSLKNQIAMAQKRLEAKKHAIATTKPSFSCKQCSKTFKSMDARTKHFNAKHSTFTPCTTSEISNSLGNQTTTTTTLNQVETMKETNQPRDATSDSLTQPKEFISIADRSDHSKVAHTGSSSSVNIISPTDIEYQNEVSQQHRMSSEPETNLIHISYYCQRCQKEFSSAAEHLKHFRTEHTEMKSFQTTAQDSCTNAHIMKCPKAKFPTLVYLSFETAGKRISILVDKTNRCPHATCQLSKTNYEFEGLCSHICKEHNDIKLKLECCNPTIMYTLDEYQDHVLSGN